MFSAAPFHRRALVAGASLVALSVVLTGCQLGDNGNSTTGLSSNATNQDFARGTGSPTLSTKNTIRIPGADAVANAAGAALTVYPSNNAFTRPKIATVVDQNDWRAAITMSVFSARPLGAPMLLSSADELPDITESAFTALNPSAVTIPGQTLKPKAIVAGNLKLPEKTPRVNLVDNNYEQLSLAADRLWTKLSGGKPSREVIVTTGDPALKRYALPAGPLAANTGSPVFFVNKDTVPLATLRAIAGHKKPSIYVIGPPKAISPALVKRLRRYGTVRQVGGVTPADNAVQVSAFSDPATGWGWGITDVGHGMVIINAHNEMNVAASTTLSSGAAYGPLLMNSNPLVLDRPLREYLLDIQPGYYEDPADAVYNRAWLLGDEKQISPGLQATLDKLLTVFQITDATGATAEAGATAAAP
jgi:hypothetical protein